MSDDAEARRSPSGAPLAKGASAAAVVLCDPCDAASVSDASLSVARTCLRSRVERRSS